MIAPIQEETIFYSDDGVIAMNCANPFWKEADIGLYGFGSWWGTGGRIGNGGVSFRGAVLCDIEDDKPEYDEEYA